MKSILCLGCRAEFTSHETEGAMGCPKCKDPSTPGDLTRKFTVELTPQEWRVLTMWAHGWAHKVDTQHADERREGQHTCVEVVMGILGEMKRQNPDMPPLTLDEELQQVANQYGHVEKHMSDGTIEIIKPEIKKETLH